MVPAPVSSLTGGETDHQQTMKYRYDFNKNMCSTYYVPSIVWGYSVDIYKVPPFSPVADILVGRGRHKSKKTKKVISDHCNCYEKNKTWLCER